MPDTKKEHEPDEKNPFIKQTIIEDNKERNKKVISAACLAIVFGMVAGPSMALTSHIINKNILSKKTKTTIEIPKEETTVESSEEAESSEHVEDIVASAIESIDLNEKNLVQMYESLSKVAEKKDNTIVKISAVTTDTDWFNNTLQNESSCSGIIIAKSGDSLIVLAPNMEKEGGLQVSLNAGSNQEATVIGSDQLTNLMILSVDISSMEEKIKSIEPVVLGNSYQLKKGAFILAVGSPVGVSRSIDIGNITAIDKNASFFDGYGRVIYCDKHLDSIGTFLLDTSGNLVGVVSNLDDSSSISMAYGISDLKVLIENMTNGVGSAYLGVRALDIDKDKAPEGMPSGIYVSEVRSDSPAYNIGIQSGDIISMIGNEEVNSITGFKNIMEKLKPNQVINIKVNRSGKDGFTELNFETTIGARS